LTTPSLPVGYKIEPLDPQHDRTAFSCGVPSLDRYLHAQAGQDARRRVATCFVLVDAESPAVAGFYTLSAATMTLADLPPEITKRLPRYPQFPATLLGRLAVSRDLQGRRLGETLLMDAFARTLRSEIGSFAVIVDPLDASAGAFYARFGFRPFEAGGRRMFIPLAEVAETFA
jgi:GNAT superfamily N-acetyltransferase